jgi:hypothetical protein
MKTIGITCILLVMFFVFACSEKKEEQVQKQPDTTGQVLPDNQDSQSTEQEPDINSAPDEAKPMINDIIGCLKTAVDNAKSHDEGIAALRICEKDIREKYKDKLTGNEKFERYFEEYGQMLYNKEKIRLKQKFNQ